MLQLEASARANLGLFTVADAKRLSVSDRLIGYHSRPGGRWARVLPRVYELTGLPRNDRRPLLAALLWAGDGAVLSHRCAAGILGLDGIRRPKPELWAPRLHTTDAVIVHRGMPAAEHVTVTGPLRHTTAVRTVVDLATVLDLDTLELVVESVLRKYATVDDLEKTKKLRDVLARRPPGAPPTESELETRYIQVVRLVSIPAPERQHRVMLDGICLGRLDLCWPEIGMWVELDGRASHDQPPALLYDRHRQNELTTRLQWQPLRFTWADVVQRPKATARFTETAYRRRLADRALHL